MASFKKFVKSNRIKWIAVTVAGIVLAGGLIALTARVSENETMKKLGSSDYSVGALSDETGKLLTGDDEVENVLYTDKFYKLEDLVCEIDDRAEIKYQVNYYNADKLFLAVQDLSVDFSATEIPEAAATAKYVRIEIIPLNDSDEEISWVEKGGYVDQLTVRVKK